jgi:hypothetical protein
LQLQDGKNHRRGAYEKIVGYIVVDYLNGGRNWGFLDTPPIIETVEPDRLNRANALFHETLRALVDQWIASGISEDETESPSSRFVRGLPNGYSESLFDILHDWLGRNMPRPALMNDGIIAMLEQRPNPFGLDVETYAREMAIFYLKELLESPARNRVERCRNPKCGKYFARKRKSKDQIKRGSYCGERELIGAAERTKLSRKRRKNQQLEVAAEAWARWNANNRHPDQASWVASQVNRKLPRLPTIQAKWVTQNKREIVDRTFRLIETEQSSPAQRESSE